MDEVRLITLIGGCASGLVLVIIAGGFLLFAAYFRFRAYRSRNWPSVIGTVLAASVRDGGNSDNTWTYPQVTYTYDVAGQRYTGTRIAFGQPSSPRYAGRRAALAKYPLNGPLTVYYDPQQPSSAVLERREASYTYWIIGAIVLVVAVVFPVLFVVAGLAAMNSV